MPVMRFEPPASPLDRIARALEVVGAIYGIKTNSANLDKLRADQKRQEEQDARTKEEYADKRSGVISKADILRGADSYSPAQHGDKGAIEFKVREGDNTSSVFLKPKEKAVDPLVSLLREEQLKKIQQGNDSQKAAALYGKRLQQAEEVFRELEKNGYNRANFSEGIQSILPNAVQNTNLQQQEQAERNFLNAVLRRESGAVISPGEFISGAKQYFPRAGDSIDVLNQKRANREQAIAGFTAAAGPAWEATPFVSPLRASKNKDGSILINSAMASEQKPEATEADIKALKWLKANPKDPSAPAVRDTLRRRGF